MTDGEIIETLATKVMGWKLHGEKLPGPGIWATDDKMRLIAYLDGSHVPGWNPIESISDAWMLVEALRNRFRRIEVMAVSDKVDGMAAYCCQIEDGTSEVDEGYIAISDADSAPRAICLAALMAVNVEVAK